MRFGKVFLVAVIVALTSFGSFSARAEEPSAVMLPIEKLSRGIANAAFGVLEIFMKWSDVSRESGGIAGLTYGTLKGVAYCVAREVVGVVDIVTFLIPLPGCPDGTDDAGWGYGPIMTPAWVVPVGTDWNGFIYNESAIVTPSTN